MKTIFYIMGLLAMMVGIAFAAPVADVNTGIFDSNHSIESIITVLSAGQLSSRAIIGSFYKTLKLPTVGWVDAISMMFGSDQESETYKWLGQVPAMREWVGGRQAKGFTSNGITIDNLHFESSIEILVDELRRDKTGQIMVRINELARRTNSHWASLLSTLILNGESTTCYDGQYFFDTDHSEGDSGSQSNDIEVDISTLPVSVFGSTTAPSVEEFQLAITRGVQAMLAIKDNQGEPMNEDLSSVVVMVPMSYWHVAQSAVKNGRLAAGDAKSNLDILDGITINIAANVRLTWTTKFALFRTDSETKALIRQQETPVKLDVIGEGSEMEVKDKKHMYGVDTWRNVGYGFWQDACLVTLI